MRHQGAQGVHFLPKVAESASSRTEIRTEVRGFSAFPAGPVEGEEGLAVWGAAWLRRMPGERASLQGAWPGEDTQRILKKRREGKGMDMTRNL